MQRLGTLQVDETLLAAARAGDETSFARLIEPCLGPGYRLAASMLADAGGAEDVVQESTLRAWRSIGQLRASSMVRPWFLSIVANRCRTMRRTRWWSVIRLPLSGTDRASGLDPSEHSSDLVIAIRRLKPDERAAIFLRFFEDMNSREVGQALGISATAARSRIHRALKQLRVELKEEQL